VQVSTSFSDLQEFGSKIIGPHIATERPSAPVRPYAPGMRKNQLFAGTVRDNIARMREADDAEVIKAARIAGMHEMILRLPDGYQTQIGDGGARLSAGQRQRVALARAVFGGPRLVVLDEPNANLDTDGELALAQAVTALRESGATTIVISHRQNILMQTDKILHLRNGRVDMFGPRNEVLRHLMTPRQQGSTLPSPLHPVVAAEPGKRESAP
jgi:ABC-type protease/lipase transport system fused ATPase/permease subunit